MSGGYLGLFSIRSVAFRIHWTFLVVPLVFVGFPPDPFAVLVFLGLVLVHELGHAFVARMHGLRVHAIAVDGLGGSCRHESGRPIEDQAVAWGGVLAQAWLGVALEAWLLAGPRLGIPFADDPSLRASLEAVATTNLHLALANLIPIPPFDGFDAWRLPLTLLRGATPHLGLAEATRDARVRARRDDFVSRADADVDALVADALAQAKRDASRSRDGSAR